jgi:hypothetical protein
MKQAVGDLHLTVGKYRLRYRIADLAGGEPPLLLSSESLGSESLATAHAEARPGVHVACRVRHSGIGLLKNYRLRM